MTYQVRHRRYGVFQGVQMTEQGIAMCYHPAADSPEMGFCEFPNLEAATDFVRWALDIDTLGYTENDLLIESYNKRGSDQLQRLGVHIITLDHWVNLVDKIHG